MSADGKERLIEATRRIIGRQGLAAATMRAIAAEAGLSTGAIYHHYRNREEILYDVMAASLSETARIRAAAQAGEADRDAIIDEICRNIRKRFDKADENRLQFQLAQEAMSGDAELRGRFAAKYREWVGGSRDLLAWLYGGGGGGAADHAPDPARQALAAWLIAAVDGSVLQHLLETGTTDPDRAVAIYREFLKVGIPSFLEHLERVGL